MHLYMYMCNTCVLMDIRWYRDRRTNCMHVATSLKGKSLTSIHSTVTKAAGFIFENPR